MNCICFLRKMSWQTQSGHLREKIPHGLQGRQIVLTRLSIPRLELSRSGHNMGTATTVKIKRWAKCGDLGSGLQDRRVWTSWCKLLHFLWMDYQTVSLKFTGRWIVSGFLGNLKFKGWIGGCGQTSKRHSLEGWCHGQQWKSNSSHHQQNPCFLITCLPSLCHSFKYLSSPYQQTPGAQMNINWTVSWKDPC